MKTPPEIERLRSQDDQAVGLAAEMLAIISEIIPASEVYNKIKRDIQAAKDANDPIAATIGMMSLVGFWAAIEAMEREIRESEGPA